MKKTIVSVFSVLLLLTLLFAQTAQAQDKRPEWPGVTTKVLVDNENVNVSEVTFAPGAVADWHSHPQYTAYALTDVKMQTDMKGKESTVAELKPGQAIWSPAVTHKTTNVGKKPFTVIVSEIKEVPRKN
jgi:quercetin dioxygenase-like cupin family protein